MGYGGKWDAYFSLLNGLPETNYFMKLLVWKLVRKPIIPPFIIFLQIQKIPSGSIEITSPNSLNSQKLKNIENFPMKHSLSHKS